ncbi:TonB family protein (plasmid) [Dyella sp. BiH032]|uniref:energy transducer TonB n=1 Tax=Dyella sp. BiH032 TaxID=3075430 RepID=UPI0028935368|nr:TonB family protein [Dyella sp. BiH032]WNL48477.1 TonB family protein [Dyella sp. BiH032]
MKPSRIVAWTLVLLVHLTLSLYISLPSSPMRPLFAPPAAARMSMVAVSVVPARVKDSEPETRPEPRQTHAQPKVAVVRKDPPKPTQSHTPTIRIASRPQDLVASPLQRPEVAPKEIASYRVTDMPNFPLDAWDEGKQGWVVLIVLVGIDGAPEGVSVIRSVSPEIDAAAIAAVAKWKFEPGLIGGRPVQSWISVPIGFFKGRLSKGTVGRG